MIRYLLLLGWLFAPVALPAPAQAQAQATHPTTADTGRGQQADTPTPSKPVAPPPVQPAPGWDFSVTADRLPRVDNLALGPDRSLYVTLERGRKQGQVIRLAQDGVTAVISHLQKADGLAIRGKHLFVTEETIGGRVLMVGLTSGKVISLGNFQNPEGIAIRPDGSLLLTEDVRDGRLLSLTLDGQATTLIKHLRRPEGIALAPDGTVYIAETGSGRVIAYRNGNVAVIAEGLTQPDQLLLGPGGGLWVTEDQPNGRLLRIDAKGTIAVIASRLHYPQGMLYMGGRLLVSEQGRQRILAFFPTAPAR